MAELALLLLQLLQLYRTSESTRLVIVPLDVLLAELLAGLLPEPELAAALEPFHELAESDEVLLLRKLAALLALLPEGVQLPKERVSALSRACDTLLTVTAAGREAISQLSFPLDDTGVLRLVQELRIEPPEESDRPSIIFVGGPFAHEVTIELRGERLIEGQTEIIYGDHSPFPHINSSLLEVRRSRSRQNLRKPVVQLPGAGHTLELYSNKERKVGSIQTIEEPLRSVAGRALTLSFPANARASLLVTSVRDDNGALLSQVIRVVGQA